MFKMRFLFLTLLISIQSFAQVGTGQWRLHVPNKKALDVVQSGNSIFTAFENGLFEYSIDDAETSLWTDVNSLSDINLTCLGYYPSTNAVYVGYDNGNIDKISNNRVLNIPAIRLAQVPGNKRINKIVAHQGFLYFATGFSIVKIDPIKDEVKETFYPTIEGAPILDVAFRGDSIFALTSTKMLRANINNNALADPTQWVVDTRLNILTQHAYNDLEIVNNQIYVLFKNDAYGFDSVFHVNDTGIELELNEPFSLEINSLNSYADKLTVNCEGAIYMINPDNSYFLVRSSYGAGQWIGVQNSLYSEGIVWVADNKSGLIQLKDAFSSKQISFDGPPKKEFYSMDWLDGKLAVAGGGLSSISSTFSGSGFYLFEDEKWSLFDRDNMSLWNNQNIWDFLSVSINPTNTKQIAVATFSEIPISILDNSTQVSQTFTPANSTLENTWGTGLSSLASSVKYDESGNLWVLNGYSEKPLKVYTKDGVWQEFDCGSSAKNKLTRQMVIDYNGNKWFSVYNMGLYGYNDNNTISNSSDDKIVFLNSGESSGALPSNTVNAIAVDFDNEIWIGTDNGFAVLYNSAGSFDAGEGSYNAQRIKVEFEGNVEYVLGNTNITDIEVDGGNRKWFGTANSGIILLSPDGQEVIHQFTKENSPLISNNIVDLKLDQSTGELFIITDLGLVSYRTDASYEDPDYTNVKVFPNPAHPDFEGPITIQGIRYNSDVKITDVAGNLVYQTTSNGGTATWNGKTITGEKVTTGVYLIWTAANEGKGRNVGKVLVVH